MLLLLLLLLPLPLLWAGPLWKDPEYRLQVQKSVTVQEGLCVQVPCIVTYPPVGLNDSTPAYGYWYWKKDIKKDVLVATNNKAKAKKIQRKAKSRFFLSGDLGASSCSLSITDAQKGDSGNYYFRLERGQVNHSYQSNPLTVTVTVLTQTPDIRIKEPLESGCPSHLTCSMPGACDRATPLTISWMGAALRRLGLDLEAYNSSEILLIPSPKDHGTNLTCRVTFPGAGVSTQRTIKLSVLYAPQKLTVSILRGGNHKEPEYVGNGSSLPVREGDSLRLLCVADSNPPATLSWAQGSRTLSPSQPWEPGVLELPRVESGHEGEFTCRAQHPRGSLHGSLRLLVQNPPQLLGPSCSWEDQGLLCSCSSRAQPAPSVRWRLGEGLLEGNHSNASCTVTSRSAGPWANSSLSLSGDLSAGLRISCEARNVHGAPSAAVLLLPGKLVPRKTVILGALGGAGVTGLLSLCLCFIFFIVKTCRKDAPEAAAGEDAPSTLGPTSWGSHHECPPGSHLDHLPPAVAAPALGEDLELHYASLTFQGRRPWEPPDQEAASTTEYAEIKIRK